MCSKVGEEAKVAEADTLQGQRLRKSNGNGSSRQ